MFLPLHRTVEPHLQYQKLYHVASRHRSLHLFSPEGGGGGGGGGRGEESGNRRGGNNIKEIIRMYF